MASPTRWDDDTKALMVEAFDRWVRPRATDPKRTRRSRRRLRGKSRGDRRYCYGSDWGDALGYSLLGDTHIGQFSPTARVMEKQRRYIDGAYAMGADKFKMTLHNPELIPGVTVVGSVMGGDILHEYRAIAAVDWAALEHRALQHGLTKMVQDVSKMIDDTLRNTMLHGSSETATKDDTDA